MLLFYLQEKSRNEQKASSSKSLGGAFSLCEIQALFKPPSSAVTAGINLLLKQGKENKMDIILPNIVQPIIVGVFSVIVALLGTYRQTKNLNQGLRALLKVTMYDKYMQAKADGYIHVDELENFNDMYTQYAALGGNSIITGMHKRLNDGEVEIIGNEENK